MKELPSVNQVRVTRSSTPSWALVHLMFVGMGVWVEQGFGQTVEWLGCRGDMF